MRNLAQNPQNCVDVPVIPELRTEAEVGKFLKIWRPAKLTWLKLLSPVSMSDLASESKKYLNICACSAHNKHLTTHISLYSLYTI